MGIIDNKYHEERNLVKKRVAIYLAVVYGIVLTGWFLAVALPETTRTQVYSLLIALFSLFPFVANLLTRIITKDKSPWMIRPNLKHNWKSYLVAAFIPGTLIFLGAVLYFLIFPGHLDLSAEQLIATYGTFGVPDDLPHTVASIIRIGIVGIFISPLVFPITIIALGEEIGWRGYLLPKLLQLMETKKAIVLSGVLWGLCHAPLIYFGFNYGSDYWGAPWMGMIMMTLVGVVLGTWLSFVTIRTSSVIPASILHGAANVIGEWPLLVALPGVNTLLGPNPTGIIGMSFLILGALICLTRLPKSTN